MAIARDSKQKNSNKVDLHTDQFLDAGADFENSGELRSTMTGLGMLAQARMEVGRVDDPAEIEADAMALDFLRWQQSAGQQGAPTQRQVSTDQTSRSTSGGTMETGGFAVDGGLESEIARETGRGSGLDGSTRGQFEGFFGVDLGGVRLHADSKAAELSRSLGAEAFTVGNDVFFGEGKFSAGSSSGMGLLAHELTHVVQQGGSSMRRVDPNAVALSRSPLAGTQMIRRADYSDSSTLEGGALDMTEKATGGASAAADMKDWEDVSKGFVKAEKDADGVESAEGLALVSSTLNTISAITSLWEVFSEPSTTQEKGWVVFGALKSAFDISKSACEAAKAAATLTGGALAVIPGLGLAISVMSFADTLINTFSPLWKASSSTKDVLENLRKQNTDTFTTEQKKEFDIRLASVETLLSTERRQIAFAVVDMVADLTMIVGQVATLAAGPFGTAVTLLGVALNLGGQAVKKATLWSISHIAAKKKQKAGSAERDVESATTELEAAELAAKDPAAKAEDVAAADTARAKLAEKKAAYDQAYMALVKSDANTAFKEILDMSFAPLRDTTKPSTMDPSMRAMLKTHGISEQFINVTCSAIASDPHAKIDYDAAIDEAVAVVAVGEPKTFGARIASWGAGIKSSWTSVSNWFGRLFNTEASRMKASQVNQDGINKEVVPMIGIVEKYVKKKAKQGAGGVKPEMVTEYLQKPYKNLMARILNTGAVVNDVLPLMKNALESALKAVLTGATVGGSAIDLSTVEVVAEEKRVAVSYKSNNQVIQDEKAKAAAAAAATQTPPPAKPNETINPLYAHGAQGKKA